MRPLSCPLFFFFNDTATTEIYTLSLHDALPILPTIFGSRRSVPWRSKTTRLSSRSPTTFAKCGSRTSELDRKSTRLNSSHLGISYAVFCLKKKKLIQPDVEGHEVPPCCR